MRLIALTVVTAGVNGIPWVVIMQILISVEICFQTVVLLSEWPLEILFGFSTEPLQFFLRYPVTRIDLLEEFRHPWS